MKLSELMFLSGAYDKSNGKLGLPKEVCYGNIEITGIHELYKEEIKRAGNDDFEPDGTKYLSAKYSPVLNKLIFDYIYGYNFASDDEKESLTAGDKKELDKIIKEYQKTKPEPIQTTMFEDNSNQPKSKKKKTKKNDSIPEKETLIKKKQTGNSKENPYKHPTRCIRVLDNEVLTNYCEWCSKSGYKQYQLTNLLIEAFSSNDTIFKDIMKEYHKRYDIIPIKQREMKIPKV